MRRSAIDMLIETVCAEIRFGENSDYRKAANKANDCDDILREQLKGNGKLLEALKNLQDAHGEMCIEETDAYFKEGFSLGILLGLEIAGYNK